MPCSGEQALTVDGPATPNPRATRDLIVPLALCVLVAVYWHTLEHHTIRQVPLYLGEMKAIRNATWLTMWTWTDYGGYYRYSPTALLAGGFIDRYFVAPLLGISFDTPQFTSAERLIPVYIFAISLCTFLMYRLCRRLSLSSFAALGAAVFLGFNKGFAYYFTFASTIATFCLLLYGFGLLFSGLRYVKTGRRRDLTLYYVALLLSVGTWEQWLNWVVFLVPASLMFRLFTNHPRRRQVMIHGALLPLLIGMLYVAMRYPTMKSESSSVSEAQYVFSYPSRRLMAEDMVTNASLHIASIVEPLVVPWPLLSQSVIHNNNMAALNPYNAGYTPYATIHYRGFGDWYGGVLFGLFLSATVWMGLYARRHVEHGPAIALGLGMTYCGFAAHLPIMYRTYFVLPGYASLLDYKHPLSIVGFSILVGWAIGLGLGKIRDARVKSALLLGLCGWVIYCNYMKVAIQFAFERGVFPW